jgi:hypothetical protein
VVRAGGTVKRAGERHKIANYAPTAPQSYDVPKPRKKRRVFLWISLAIQVLFLVWIIAGLASNPNGPSVASQVASTCDHHGWFPLYKSQADCVRSFGRAMSQGEQAA